MKENHRANANFSTTAGCDQRTASVCCRQALPSVKLPLPYYGCKYLLPTIAGAVTVPLGEIYGLYEQD